MKQQTDEQSRPEQTEQADRDNPPIGRDTTHGSDFAQRMNEIDEDRWKRYNRIGGILVGLLMGGCMFLFTKSAVISDSVRLLVTFVLGFSSTVILERQAERSVSLGKRYLAFAFGGTILVFVIYLLLLRIA